MLLQKADYWKNNLHIVQNLTNPVEWKSKQNIYLETSDS